MAQELQQTTPPAIAAMIEHATKLLVEAAHPEKLILFGSYARSDFDSDSDLDFLIVLPTVESRITEMARLSVVLRDIPISIDVVVHSRAQFETRRHLRGTMLYHALKEGTLLHDAA